MKEELLHEPEHANLIAGGCVLPEYSTKISKHKPVTCIEKLTSREDQSSSACFPGLGRPTGLKVGA